MTVEHWIEVPWTTRRATGVEAASDWSSERRALYLLRDDVVPISADSTVSPESNAESSVEMKLYVCSTDSFDFGGLRVGPAQREDWTFLGYDVCDEAMLSGLMNCGYEPCEGRTALQAEWSQRLNRWHLFDSLVDARQFCALTEQRVPEHAPFRLVAVYVRPVAKLENG